MLDAALFDGSLLDGVAPPPAFTTDRRVSFGLFGIKYAFSMGVVVTDGTRVAGSFTETDTTSIKIAQNFPAGSTNVLLSISWTIASTQAIFLHSTSNLTIKTNSSGSPANT